MTEEDILKNYKTGDSFTASIEGQKCEGKITIRDKDSKPRVYFCQEVRTGNEIPSVERHGYSKSWLYDGAVNKVEMTHTEKKVVDNYKLY